MSSVINRNQLQRSFHSMFEVDNATNIFVPVGYIDSENAITYRIPEHQRFYKWTLDQERLFIDSLIQNYPIHSIITTTRIDTTATNPSIYYDVEDGQSRLTCCWKFANDRLTIIHEGIEIKFSELPQSIRTMISNYMIPFEELSFTQVMPRQREQAVVSDIFIRINYGKQLTHNDKYHACSHVPVMVVIRYLKQTLNTQMRKYCGNVGGGKSRLLLSDFAAVILTIAHGNMDSLITSFSENYHLLNDPISDASVTRVRRFFTMYFNMLDTQGFTGKSITRLPKFLGYCVYLFITDTDNDFTTNPALTWYLSRLKQNKKFVPATFSILPSASQRNCGQVAIGNRMQAIQVAYEQRNQENDNLAQNDEDDSDDSDSD
jgi:hypothetical protein